MKVFLLTALVILLSLPSLSAQTGGVTIYPTVLYPGNNVITIRSPEGLRQIDIGHTPNIEIEGDEQVDLSCEQTYDIHLYVGTATSPATLNLKIVDCNGRATGYALQMNRTWRLDTIRFRVDYQQTQCKFFEIRLSSGIIGLGGGESIILDSVTSPSENIDIRIPTRLPLTIPTGATFKYQVCFRADKLGLYQFPVITWIRREFPNGGYTSYPVADTGVVRVMEPYRAPSDSDWIVDVPAHDPTTFRSVAVPNAILPAKGKLVVGMYDFLGLIAAYAPTDNVMILAGGAVPTPDDWGGIRGEGFGAYSIGLKAGLEIAPKLNAAVGYQYGRSMYDKQITPDPESQISFHAPYAALSYGTDSSRISATFGYIFKHHRTLIEDPAGNFFDEFDRQVPILAIGGDYQFANHWKIAGEIATMRTLGAIPIIATARYFSDNYAVDFGVGYVGIGTDPDSRPAVPLLPVLSGVFVF